MRRGVLKAAVAAGAVLPAVFTAGSAYADTYANWAAGGSSGAWTGVGAPAAGFPKAALTSNASSLTVPSGASAFQGPSTPIGAKYGNSQGQNYVNISTAAGFSPSTSTVTFDTPAVAGKWAFALGDVDADQVQITGTDAGGNPLTAAQLGFQSTYNYCAGSPKPSSCTGGGPFTDVPTWNPATGTLVGNGPDTLGAAGWFEPTAAVKTLTFQFTRITPGSPIYQLWIATKSVPITTVVEGADAQHPVELILEEPDGTPVTDETGAPIIVVTDPSGTATFPEVADGDYVIEVKPPAGGSVVGPSTVPVTVNVDNGPVTLPPGTFKVSLPKLPATGTHTPFLVPSGVALLLAGATLVRATRH